jgi:tetratricopeptide (TPR) repeat protein
MNAGEIANRAGDYRTAAARYELALREAESFGANDLRLARTLNNLAEVYRAQGRFDAAEPLYGRALGIRENTLGPDDLDLGVSLNNVAALYQDQGRFTEAEPLYRRALGIRENALGPDHPDVGASLNNIALLYRTQGRFTDAESLYRRALQIAERALGPGHADVGRSLNYLAELYQDEGRSAEAEPLYRRALSIREKALGPDHPDVGESLNDLGVLYRTQGRFAEAEPLYRRALEIRERAFGPDHPDVASSLNNVATLYQAQGRFAEAEPPFRRSLAIYEKTLGPDHPDVGTSLNNLAFLYQAQGRLAEAEPLYRRALGITEKTLPDHADVGTALNNLALLYQTQGRLAEAESLYRRALGIFEKTLAPEHPNIPKVLNNLAKVYRAQGRFAEAESLYRRALETTEKTLPDHADVGTLLNNLALLYQTQGRMAEAEPLYLRALEIREKALGPDHSDVANSLNNLAVLYRAQGVFTQAFALASRALEIRERAFGPDHPDVGDSLNNLAVLYQRQGKPDDALALARRATKLLSRRFATNSGGSRQGMLAEQRTHSGEFQFHVALLAEVANRGPKSRSEAAAESFVIAQLARASDTAEQVGKMAARYAAGSDTLAKLARARQDALAKFDQLDARIVKTAGARGNETSAANLRAEQVETMGAIATLDVRLEREYPQYRELINPSPMELAVAQRLLGGDEALVLFLVSDDESYLWAVRRRESGFYRLAVTRNELAAAVQKLRTQLDLGVNNPAAMLRKPFDVAAAHALYRTILGPADAMLKGATQMILVPDGALQSLPPGVLVTELPAKPIGATAEHAQVAWLAKKYAITVLPAAASLRALRQFAKAPASREPFAGFGDPVLVGSGERTRRLNVTALYSRGAVADVNEVRKLPRLPETAGELRAIAVELKAPATSIRLGADATERAVKEADLARYRNLAFATHGLMAGDFKGLAEPALVLTPPAQGSELDDGLLTAGEISQLKLDADWVVLSACNTAAPDGTPGAEGLSGLAQAFFYAGARSLLVSHWAVSSDAAAALTTRMFDEFSKGASKAEALRRSMLALMARTDKWYFAHPALWAPFVVVGEGNVEWALRR